MPPQQIFFFMSPRYSEDSIFNRNLGRKPKSFAVWKEGLMSLSCIGGGKLELGTCLDKRELSPLSVLETAERGMCLPGCQCGF